MVGASTKVRGSKPTRASFGCCYLGFVPIAFVAACSGNLRMKIGLSTASLAHLDLLAKFQQCNWAELKNLDTGVLDPNLLQLGGP